MLKDADFCTVEELTVSNVVSSRIRLARNVRGIPFAGSKRSVNPKLLDVIKGAAIAAEGLFDFEICLMSRLTKQQKTALVERHLISLPLANNTATGAVIIERDTQNMSIMLNEEDHIREQCVVNRFDLQGAYKRIDAYDDKLIKTLPIAYDNELGFLTACPTNLGTGMRASAMLFLPALKRAGAIDDALATFKKEYGLTVRGVYGEGSNAGFDMYQISNSRTLGVDEKTIIKQVEDAVVRMCYCERVALSKLVLERKSALLDGIMRSYSILRGAYSISSQELMQLIVDVKMGVILDILPIKYTTTKLDELAVLCSPSSICILTGDCSESERDIRRAQMVRRILSEEK